VTTKLFNTDSLIDLVREMEVHGIVEYDKIIPHPEDVLTKLLKFVEYRFPEAPGTVNVHPDHTSEAC
jgi:hypothetical protein